MSIKIPSEFVAQYSALLLDSDGTIGDTERVHAKIGAEIMSQAGVPTSFDERFRMKGFGEARIWDEMAQRGTPIQIPRQDFIDAQTRGFVEYIRKVDNPLDIRRRGMLELITAFKEAGKPVAIVSNTPTSAVEALKQATDLSHLIDMTITYDHIAELGLQKKPAPDGYDLARERLNLLHNQATLIVEDSPTGANAGVQAKGRNDVMQIIYDTLQEEPIKGIKFVVHDSGSLLDIFRNSNSHHAFTHHSDMAAAHTPVNPLMARNLNWS